LAQPSINRRLTRKSDPGPHTALDLTRYATEAVIDTPLVSVVVPTYCRRASLARLLDALDRQSYPRSCFEVLVVDDGSTDDTVQLVEERGIRGGVRVIQQQHAGPAEARNRGVAAATGNLVLFLDDDVVPVPELITTHVATHAAEPNAVVIGPMSAPRHWPRPIWVRWEEVQLDKQYRAMIAGDWGCTARQFYTGNASVARTHFLAAGGFDTSFQRAEDVELGYRLADRGARFIFNPEAEVLHFASRSFESWCRIPYQYGRYDVVMQRDKGQHTLDNAAREFHQRHPLNRALLRICAGRPQLVEAVVPALARLALVAERLGAGRPALYTLSAIFNLRYWQGVFEEVGTAGSGPRIR
jgi:GT2 family glycosyltransferase